MRKFAHETIIITKEAWKFMWNFERAADGYKPCTDAQLENIWNRCFRNKGANPATHPIADNEIRVDRDSFNMRFDGVKSTLDANGFGWRVDGFIAEGVYI